MQTLHFEEYAGGKIVEFFQMYNKTVFPIFSSERGRSMIFFERVLVSTLLLNPLIRELLGQLIFVALITCMSASVLFSLEQEYSQME